MKRLLLFVFAGLAINTPPEVVNQIFVRKSVDGFFHTTLVYVVFLFVLYFLKILYNRLVRLPLANAVIWYALLGFLGLFIEWHLLGNRDAAWYGQIAMFTFWGSFGVVPMIFAERPVPAGIRHRLIIYCVPWILLYLLAGLVNAGLGLLLWIIGCDFLNFFYIDYFRWLKQGDKLPSQN